MPSPEHSEIERSYAVSEDASTPDLTSLEGVATLGGPETFDQVATYYDTPDLRLLASGITLRRRVGGDDDGWHLKLPRRDDARHEVRLPLDAGDEGVPTALADRVRVHVRDSALAPVAVLHTHRVIHRLLDAEGGVLADLCDDRVHAESAPQGELLDRWREWELEVVAGPPSLLDEAEPRMLECGARPSAIASKVARALSPRLATVASWRTADRSGFAGTDATTGTGGSGGSAATRSLGDLLASYLAEQLAALQEQDRRLRSGDPEGVHQLRVAARRMRAALSGYGHVLETGVADHLSTELRWLGAALSDARDAQVVQERVKAHVEHLSPELIVGPVRARLDSELAADFETALSEAHDALEDPRYFRLQDSLEGLLVDPPYVQLARTPASDAIPPVLLAEMRRVRKRHKRVVKAREPQERTVALHNVRKAAKRLRYTAEVAQGATPAVAKTAGTLAKRAKKLQRLLGEHQDGVVSRAHLRALAKAARGREEDTFTYGVLHGWEEGHASVLERDYPALVTRVTSKKVRSRLRG